MARTRRRPHSSLIDDVVRRPEAYALFQAIRLLERSEAVEARDRDLELPDAVGRGVDPARAALIVRANVPLGFAAAEVNQVRRSSRGPMEMTQSVVGLIGPSGVLPHALTEIVQVSVRDRNPGLRAFLDLFNDRLTGILYDAWAKHRLVIETERRALTGQATIDALLHALVGLGTPGLTGRLGSPESVAVHHGGLLSRQSRSAHAVAQTLTNALGHAVEVEQFLGEWLPVAPLERTRMPGRDEPQGSFCRLGDEVVIGERTWNVQSAVRLLIGPLDYPAFAAFLPSGVLQKRLAGLAAFALGADMSFRLRLTLRAAEVPPLRLEDDPERVGASRLGWNTWLGSGVTRTQPGVVDITPSSALQRSNERLS